MEFGWRGIKLETDLNLIILFTAFQIKSAKREGYKYIEGEIDTTDPYSIANYLPKNQKTLQSVEFVKKCT